MLRILSVVLVGCTVAALAYAQDVVEDKPVVLNVGDQAPEFEALDDTGEEWKSIDHVGKKILVVYFYPADTTGGCTAQACGYRDALADLEEQGVEVVGVSGDTVESHKLFKEAEDLNFTLLSDYEGKVARAFGVKTAPGGAVTWKNAEGEDIELVRGITAMRWTFVIDEDGHIAYKNEKVNHAKDPAEVLKVIAELRKKD
jgi:thioredoxin-dependent peroxiredoxin